MGPLILWLQATRTYPPHNTLNLFSYSAYEIGFHDDRLLWELPLSKNFIVALGFKKKILKILCVAGYQFLWD